MSARDRPLRVVMPILVLALGIAAWEAVVRYKDIPPYVLPAPDLIAQTFATDWPLLLRSLLVTVITTLEGFLLAAFGGVFLAILFNQSRFLEYSLYPYAVVLQVTPIVAVAPLLLIYLPQHAAVLVCAWIVAFFPVLANTTLGLRSVDRNLADLFALYGASRWQILRRLKMPSALPYILGGLRIAGGLSLIGAVVAEIAAGSAGAGSGLAYRIAEFGVSPEHSAHVRGAHPSFARRHSDFLSALADQLSRAPALARERIDGGELTAHGRMGRFPTFRPAAPKRLDRNGAFGDQSRVVAAPSDRRSRDFERVFRKSGYASRKPIYTRVRRIFEHAAECFASSRTPFPADSRTDAGAGPDHAGDRYAAHRSARSGIRKTWQARA